MDRKEPFENHDENEEVIFRMTIRRNGRLIRRKDGRPFKIVVRCDSKR